MSVDEHTIDLAGSPVFFRSAPARGVPAVYLHGVPTSSEDWLPFLAAAGGLAPDLIGFGRSGKGGHLDYTIGGLADAVEALLPERLNLVGHDWGAVVGLELAARHPDRVAALALLNPLPLVEGFEWPAPARRWRRPLLGELAMGATTQWLLDRELRRASPAWPPERTAAVWRQFDQGTQRAILRLHRQTDKRALEATRPRLGRLSAPALVLWGELDPWCPVALAAAFSALLPRATVERVDGAGHWPWIERPEVIDRALAFLADARA
ncbi:MAG: alpha/beta hydrolase [Solirubrobacterales bacterium]|nr:alpha/beta hydrolase [Solirubrobacterales bacterium]MBV9716571.1 alpha/beta hydrolase [Solirubrobacterales bacterium]